MKCLRRCLCVLLCLALSLTAFSVTADASEAPIYADSVQQECIPTDNTGYYTLKVLLYNTRDDTALSYSGQYSLLASLAPVNVTMRYTFRASDNTPIAYSGSKASVSIRHITNKYQLTGATTTIYSYIDYSSVTVQYADGSTETLTPIITSATSAYSYNFNFEFTPSSDVDSIVLDVVSDLPVSLVQPDPESTFTIYYYMGEIQSFGSSLLAVEQESKEEGLLSGILGWIQNVYNSVANGFENMYNTLSNGFQNLINSITELPAKIWGYIEDGLKSLFVPDEEFLIDYKDRWDTLLSERLGAVYQVANVTIESWERISAADEQDTVSMPSVSIPLPGGSSFLFGGYDVQIVPDGFSFLVDAVKTIAGIAGTVAFVNGLRKRYDEVMGVEQ